MDERVQRNQRDALSAPDLCPTAVHGSALCEIAFAPKGGGNVLREPRRCSRAPRGRLLPVVACECERNTEWAKSHGRK